MTINKFHFLLTFSLLIASVIFSGCTSSSSKNITQDTPNILLVLADDQSWLHTSITGNKVIKTPGFDRVAEEGVIFTNAFSACPSCTPSPRPEPLFPRRTRI